MKAYTDMMYNLVFCHNEPKPIFNWNHFVCDTAAKAYVPGFLRISPKRYVEGFDKLTEAELAEFEVIDREIKKLLACIYDIKVFSFECSHATGCASFGTYMVYTDLDFAWYFKKTPNQFIPSRVRKDSLATWLKNNGGHNWIVPSISDKDNEIFNAIQAYCIEHADQLAEILKNPI